MINEANGIWISEKTFDRLDGPESIFVNGYEVYFMNAERSIVIYPDGRIWLHSRASFKSPQFPPPRRGEFL